jgi:hypothetical protein
MFMQGDESLALGDKGRYKSKMVERFINMTF